MKQCKVSLEEGIIVATLVGSNRPPARSWKRERLPSGTIYKKNLHRLEANKIIHSKPIDDFKSISDEIEFVINPELQGLTISKELLSPVAHATWIDGSMHVEEAFRSARRGVIRVPANSLINKGTGYLVHANEILFFDEKAIKLLGQTTDGIARHQSDKTIFSYRDFLCLAKALNGVGLEVVHAYERDDVLSYLSEVRGNQEFVAPEGFLLPLKDFQEESVKWLQFCHFKGLGALLALDMGLGKTCTTIALIAYARAEGVSLVVCPLSLMENWKDEFKKFCPSLDVWISHGANKLFFSNQLLAHDVIICSYETIKSNLNVMSSIKWNVLALDEAQRIKNPASETSRACRGLAATCPVALTGTPFENRPLDLWALMDFLEPNFLGSEDQFEREFGQPISRGDAGAIDILKHTVSLFMMRQKKEEVLDQFPELVERELPIPMSEREASLYASLREQLKIKSSGTWNFGSIRSLSRFCSHPQVFCNHDEELSAAINLTGMDLSVCTKYSLLIEMLDKIQVNKEKAIIFADLLDTLSYFEMDLPKFGFKVFRIDGGVESDCRKVIVNEFEAFDDGPSVLIGNYQTLGVGLNITTANHVFHYNLPWNPAVMDQATDRTHRIGQTKGVFAYYMYYVSTVEEEMMNRINAKRDLEGQVIESSTAKEDTQEDFVRACYLRPTMYD